MRQLVTPSGRKVSHEPSDLAEYADVDDAELRRLLERLGRERIVRGVNGMQGAPTRYEIFHDVLGPPILAWQAEHQLQRERIRARQQHRRLLAIIGASLVALADRRRPSLSSPSSSGATRARRRGTPTAARSPAARSRTSRPIRRSASSSRCRPRSSPPDGRPPTSSARASPRCARRGSCGSAANIVFAAFAPRGDRLLVASSNGRVGLYDRSGRLIAGAAAAASADRGGLEPGRPALRNGRVRRQRRRSGGSGAARPLHEIDTTVAGHRAVVRRGRRCSSASGTHVRLFDLATGRTKTIALPRRRPRSRPRPDRDRSSPSPRGPGSRRPRRSSARAPGRVIRRLPETGIRSFAFSPDGKLLASGSYDRTARIWDARTGKRLHVLRHTGLRPRRALLARRPLARHLEPGRRRVRLGRCHRPARAAPRRRSGAWAPSTPPPSARTEARSPPPPPTGSGRIYYSQDGRAARAARRPPRRGHERRVRPERAHDRHRLERRHRAALGSAAARARSSPIDKRSRAAGAGVLGRQPRRSASPAAKRGMLTTSGRAREVARRCRRRSLRRRPSRSASLSWTTVATSQSSWSGKDSRHPRLDADVRSPSPATGRCWWARPTARCVATDGSRVDRSCRAAPSSGSRPAAGASSSGCRDSLRVYTDAGELVSTIHVAAQHAVLSPGGLGVATTRGKVAAALGRLDRKAPPHADGRTRSLVTDAEYSPNGLELVTVSVDHTGRIWNVRSGHLLRVLVGPLLPGQHRQLQPRRPLDRHRRASSPPVSGTRARASSSSTSAATPSRSRERASARPATGSSPAARTAPPASTTA